MPEFGSWELVRAVYGNPLVRAVFGLIVANVLLGIAVSLFKGEFVLGEVGTWLLTKAVPYLLGAGAVQLVLMTVPDEFLGGLTKEVGGAIWLFCIAAMIGQILGKLKELGIPIPTILTTKEQMVEEKVVQAKQEQITRIEQTLGRIPTREIIISAEIPAAEEPLTPTVKIDPPPGSGDAPPHRPPDPH